ncbi:MAG: hypothetical protein QM660_14720 [Dysgonomonas sp.]
MKQLLCLLLFCGGYLNLYSQVDTDNERGRPANNNPSYFSLSLGIGPSKMKNSYLSELTSSGTTFNISSNISSYKKWGIQDWKFQIKYRESDSFDDDTETFFLSASHFRHKLVHRNMNNTFFMHVGGGIHAEFGTSGREKASGYNQNSLNAYLNIEPSFLLKYRFKLGRQQFDFSQQLSTPLAGAAILPQYGFMVHTSISDSENTDLGFAFTSLHNMWGIKSSSYLDWRLTSNGTERNTFIRLGIEYTGCRVSYKTKHQLGETLFTLGFVYKL